MKPKQRKVWERVIARDNQTCVYCGGEGAEVHHVVGRAICPEEDLWTEQNMCVLCKECHVDMAHTKIMREELLAILSEEHPEYLDWYCERLHFSRYIDGWR